MNIFILLSLVVLSECNLNEADFHSPTSTTTSTEKYDWYFFNDLVTNLLKRNSPHLPASSFSDNPLGNNKAKPIPSDREIPEDLIAQVFRDHVPVPVTSSPLSTTKQEVSTPFYFSSLHPTNRPTSPPQKKIPIAADTEELISQYFRNHLQDLIKSPPPLPLNRESPIDSKSLHPKTLPTSPKPPVSKSTKPPVTSFSNNRVDLLYAPKLQHESYFHSPSSQFPYSQPLSPQLLTLPSQIYYTPQHIPVPMNPSYFYIQDWTFPAATSQNGLPPINDKIPTSSSHYISYGSPLNYPQRVQNGPLIKFGPTSLASIDEKTGVDSDPYQTLPQSNSPVQSLLSPANILSSYIPQQPFNPTVISLQPAVYGHLPPQLSQEDIISFIQNSYSLTLPRISLPPINHFSLPLPTYSYQPSLVSMPTNRNKDLSFYPSPTKFSPPMNYYS